MADDVPIVIADDHPFFRHGVRRVLDQSSSLKVVAEASDGLSALEYVRTLKPRIAILDIGLPKMDGITLMRSIRREAIPVDIIFLTVSNDEAIFEQAIALGAKGYLLKDCTDGELLQCIAAVASGHHYTSPAMTTYLVRKTRQMDDFAERLPRLRLLTPQERAVLRHIAQDKTSKDIAQEMGIALKTVDSHRANICRKLELRGQHVLTRFAARHRREI
jgi:DNA-binding NarL/FixJ family response regulator